MKRKSKAAPRGDTPLYQLKINLQWTKPAVWRRIVAPADMTLERLHEVIQLAMPWTNSHLHQFVAGETCYGPTGEEFAGMGNESLDESSYGLANIAPAVKSKFLYEYDFGDSWEHLIVVEKILPPDADFQHPVCLAGANACPPDDCGGIPGYYNLVEALADPKHPEHEELKEWIGGDWDPLRFDLEKTNRSLKRLKV
jgi:hypothetical protein